MKIYTVGLNIYFDLYTGTFLEKNSKLVKEEKYTIHQSPIFANNLKSAIEKYYKIHGDDKKPSILLLEYNYDGYNIRNIGKRKIVEEIGEFSYTMKQLQEKMDSNEFLQYCKYNLVGIEKILNT